MEKFEVIIVGAGLAGLASACTLADNGVEVLLLERGDYPGAKNVTGGRLYVNPVRDLFPWMWKDAPLERHIAHEGVTLMSGDSSISVKYSGNELAREPYQSYSIRRSVFDRWLSEQAESRGVMLMSKIRVDDLIIENGKVSGVIAGGDDLHADVVIACDGVLSLTAEKAGLRSPGKPADYAVGVKEIITLDPGLINARFNLQGDEGAAQLYMGEVTKGRFGGGFLYTNKDSLSLGIVFGIEDFMKNPPDTDVPSLLDKFKQRPEISRLIEGGTTSEYEAHVIPEGGFKTLTKLYGDGILVAGDAAGFALNIGYTVRGMEYALASGYYAAQAVIKAKEEGKFDSTSLSLYQKLLEDSFVMKDFRNFQDVPHALNNPRFFNRYPELAATVMKEMYGISNGPKEKLYPSVKKHISMGEMWAMFKDFRGIKKL
jgi:electron transfer flavoprotein-quinone oxidoreductase